MLLLVPYPLIQLNKFPWQDVRNYNKVNKEKKKFSFINEIYNNFILSNLSFFEEKCVRREGFQWRISILAYDLKIQIDSKLGLIKAAKCFPILKPIPYYSLSDFALFLFS